MTTIVNTPPAAKEGGNMGMIFGLIALIVLGYLFFVYGLPAIQGAQLGAPQINIPSEIDVNINQQDK